MSSKNKNYTILYIIIFIVILAILVFIFKDNLFGQKQNQDYNSTSNTSRLAQNSNVLGNTEEANKVNNRIDNVLANAETSPVEKKEEEIASYSTKVSGSTSNRLTNIRITCEKLNGTTVNTGDTFSFCEITGPSTAEEGYKEATMFLDGKEVQSLGGGNCQVSSTLYNAVLDVPDLKVIERHEHGKKVSYVPDGKDAAVSYGSIDFKFKNNTDNNIKLYFETDDVTLTVKIVKLV